MCTFSLFVMMSQKEKIKEFAKKSMKMKEIEQELYVLYGESYLQSTCIYKYIPEVLEEHNKLDRNIDS